VPSNLPDGAGPSYGVIHDLHDSKISGQLSKRDTKTEDRALQMIASLEGSADQLGPRPFVGVHSPKSAPGGIEAAADGFFWVGGQQRDLNPPIDWADEPYTEGDDYAFLFNSFIFADTVLVREPPGDLFARIIVALSRIYLDWIEQDWQVDHPNEHKYAWSDHAAAARLVHLAYVLREGVRLGLLDEEARETLALSVIEHADFTLSEENYRPHHNHGLFSDAALKLAADELSVVPEAASWAEVATIRFRSVVELTVDATEGVHLEHSPFYQLVIRNALARFAPTELMPPEQLGPLLERMDEASSWLTAPDGALPPIGDTNVGSRPSEAVQEAAARTSGLRAFPNSGYCVVHEGDSYLILTAGFHSEGHKHADDLSFCLYEGGRMVIIDSGNPGYDYASAARQYSVSPSAHSGIAVDGYTWIRDPRGGAGSGLVASGSVGDWYAILAENPRIAPDDRVARRLVLYRPASSLVVIDEVSASGEEVVERYLQLAPDLDATVQTTGAVEVADEHGARVSTVVPFGGDAVEPDSVSAIRGRTTAPAGGLFFPQFEVCEACTTVVLSRHGGGLLGFRMELGPEAQVEEAAATGSLFGDDAEATVTGLEGATLQVRLQDGKLALSLG
jgi:heparinase II/III-like protein